MKVVKAAVAAVLSLALGAFGLAATAPDASAYAPSVTATCEALNVNLTDYQTKPGSPQIPGALITEAQPASDVTTDPGQPYIASTPDIPATYEYYWAWVMFDYTDFVWASTSPGSEYTLYQPEVPTNTRLLTPFVEGNPGQEFIAPTVVHTDAVDAVYGPVTPAVAENLMPNHVTVTVNATQVTRIDFGTSYAEAFSFLAGQPNTYSVSVTAWDDPIGGEGGTKVFEGSQDGCVVYVPPTAKVCTGSTVLPTSTQLNPLGWGDLGNGQYVEGGIQLTATATDAAYAYVDFAPIRLSQIGDLSTGSSNGTGTFGIILGGDLNIHYEAGAYWTVTPGVFAWQGEGIYRAPNLNNLLSDPNITEVAVWVNPGGSMLLTSQNYGCQTQPFGYARAAQPVAEVVETAWTSPFACGAGSADQTRTVTTTPYVWDLETRTWVLGTATTVTEQRTLAAIHEFQNTNSEGDCYIAPRTQAPTTVVTTAKWAVNDTTAVTSSVTTTYSFAIDPATGTYGPALALAGAPIAGARDLTAAEMSAAQAWSEALASTGASDVSPWSVGAGLLVLLSGIGLLIAKKR